MRKLIVCNIVSLDGFFSGPDGNIMVQTRRDLEEHPGRQILCLIRFR